MIVCAAYEPMKRYAGSSHGRTQDRACFLVRLRKGRDVAFIKKTVLFQIPPTLQPQPIRYVNNRVRPIVSQNNSRCRHSDSIVLINVENMHSSRFCFLHTMCQKSNPPRTTKFPSFPTAAGECCAQFSPLLFRRGYKYAQSARNFSIAFSVDDLK
jgi:hypothetical protein